MPVRGRTDGRAVRGRTGRSLQGVLPCEAGSMWSGKDNQLDLGTFHNGVAVLRQGTAVMGHVATIVDSFRGLFLVQGKRVWLLVTWLDGTRERIEEDYQPWTSVVELSDGHFTWDRNGEVQDFEATWLSGQDRDRAWKDFGIHEAVEAYM
jgi:hypothetical protein